MFFSLDNTFPFPPLTQYDQCVSVCVCAAYCSSFALQVRASSDAEAKSSPLLFMQDHYMDVQQLLWRMRQLVHLLCV